VQNARRGAPTAANGCTLHQPNIDGFRPSSLQWGQRVAWAAHSFTDEWVAFVGRATPRQLHAFGFPRPGHRYWTPETLAGIALRYPQLDLSPWQTAR
jgi:hypothetical protein